MCGGCLGCRIHPVRSNSLTAISHPRLQTSWGGARRPQMTTTTTTEIHRAWMTVDNVLYIWDYHTEESHVQVGGWGGKSTDRAGGVRAFACVCLGKVGGWLH